MRRFLNGAIAFDLEKAYATCWTNLNQEVCDGVQHLLCRIVPIPGHIEPCKLNGVSPEHELVEVEHHPVPGAQINILNGLPEAQVNIVDVKATVIDALLEVGHPLCDVVGPFCALIATGMEPLEGPICDEDSGMSGSLHEFQAVISIPTVQHRPPLAMEYAGHQLS